MIKDIRIVILGCDKILVFGNIIIEIFILYLLLSWGLINKNNMVSEQDR